MYTEDVLGFQLYPSPTGRHPRDDPRARPFHGRTLTSDDDSEVTEDQLVDPCRSGVILVGRSGDDRFGVGW